MLAHFVQNQRVVLVADDDSLRGHVTEVLSHSFSDLDVRGAQNADEALVLLADERSRLLITDAQSRRLDGIALVTSAHKRRPSLPVIVMSNHAAAPETQSTQPLMAAAWLDKPPADEQLVGLVRRFLDRPAGFSGELVLDGLPELVQWLCLINTTGAVHLGQADRQGTLFFERGSLVDAHADAARGASAFFQMLHWEGGSFTLDRHAQCEQRSIHIPTFQLLLEGARLIDQARGASGAETTDSGYAAEERTSTSQVRPRSLIEASANSGKAERATLGASPLFSSRQERDVRRSAAQSFQRGMELALQKRYAAAAREWERASLLDPSNRTYLVNLRRVQEIMRHNLESGGAHGDEE
jgi:DNA-binding response OmpR family regulator